MACSPSPKVRESASVSVGDSQRPAGVFSFRMSMTPISGKGAPRWRSGRCRRRYRPLSALTTVSSDGVADASTIGMPPIRALTTAMSRAL